MSSYNVFDFGAVGNGLHDDGKAIQYAIDECSKNGGGTVVLESGNTFYSHSIVLKPDVDLCIQKGATLKAHSDIKSYLRPCETINDPKTALVGNPVTGKPSFAFIYAYKADNAAISGEGVIDGNCFSFVERKTQYYVTGNFYPRPTVIYIENSDHITVKDVTIKNAPFWTLHPAGCDDVLISRIRILNPLDVANSDGIDPDHCRNVRIEGCHIECADDCICLKNSNGNKEYGKCENIIITGCTLTSTSAAIKIGTEGVADFSNIIVDNCIISRSNRGISIQIRDCGNVENVSFSNIIIETRRFCPDFWGAAEPIAITAFRRDEKTTCGKIRNIRFFNVTAKGENGVLVHGTKDNLVSEIAFERVNVVVEKTSKWDCGCYDLRPSVDYGLQDSKNSCYYLQHCCDVSLKNCGGRFANENENFAYGLYAQGVNGLMTENVRLSSAGDEYDDIKIL